jgi:hypothetical protein
MVISEIAFTIDATIPSMITLTPLVSEKRKSCEDLVLKSIRLSSRAERRRSDDNFADRRLRKSKERFVNKTEMRVLPTNASATIDPSIVTWNWSVSFSIFRNSRIVPTLSPGVFA